MSNSVRRLFERHLPDDIAVEQVDALLAVMTDMLAHEERQTRLLERSMLLMSEELNDINRELRLRLEQTQTAQQRLQEALVRQETLMDVTPEAILHYGANNQLEYCNRAAEVLLRADRDQLRLGSRRYVEDLFCGSAEFLKMVAAVESDRCAHVHALLDTVDGRHCEFISMPQLLDGEYIGRIVCVRDLTSIRDSQELIRHQAFHDALTGLPNRILLQQKLRDALEISSVSSNRLAVLFIDLDDFKKINDTAGHQEGDRFLVDVSGRIQSSLREGDVLGRLGGDEFLIILRDITSQRQIIQVHDRILQLFAEPFAVNESHYVVSCSIGISSYPQDGSTPEELIRKADMAMYQAKAQGKNTFHYFDESLERIAIHRLSMETQLRRALERDEFHLVYQPKMALSDDRCLGVEALIRWTLPSGEMVYPDQFIPVAEESGLIRELTLWVMRKACQTINRWQVTGLAGLPVSINISAIDFADPHFLSNTLRIIGMSGINPTQLEFELTESVFFGDMDKVRTIIQRLKQIGVKLAIDDFGTGYSSLGYLQDLDIDFLKVDRSFITDLHLKPRAQAIVKSVVDIGLNLGITVVAEGVENQEEKSFLLALGCPVGQGYLFGKPLTERELLERELLYEPERGRPAAAAPERSVKLPR